MDPLAPAPPPPDQPPPVTAAPPAPPRAPKDAKELLKSGDFYLIVGVLAAILLVGAVVIHFLDRWRRRQTDSEPETPLTLTSFREMYENGEITLSEYERIRAKMAAKIKKEVGAANPSTAQPRPADTPPAVGPNGPPTPPETGAG